MHFHSFRRPLLALSISALLATAAHAADQVKVGMLSTLSGPGAGLGIDIRDGFNLALKHMNGKLGNLPAEVIVADDQQNPEVAKQTAERLLKRDKVDFMTGTVFSNVMLAVGTPAFQNKTFFISPNAGPSQYAGAQCNPYFFNVSQQNDALHEAAGKTMQDKGFKRVALIAPNYPAGKDSIAGFKRFYKGEIGMETYTALNQLDYGAELSKMRAAGADTVVSGNWGNDMALMIRAAGESGYKLRVLTHSSANKSTMIALSAAKTVQLSMVGDWYPGANNPELTAQATAFEAKYQEPFYLARLSVGTELLQKGIEKARSTDPLKIALALENLSYKSVVGDVTMRKDDHQFLSPQIIYTSHPVDGKRVTKGFDGTDYGFIKESESSAQSLTLPNECDMKRPNGV